MAYSFVNPARIQAAWAGRISGCVLGKPVEVLSFREGYAGLRAYLQDNNALPLRDYIPMQPGTIVERLGSNCCNGRITRAEPDDDINFTVLALMLMEDKGTGFDTVDVARAWLRLLPAGAIWTAERAAYQILVNNMDSEFVNEAGPGFNLAACSDNNYNEWIGAQIRADLYGWICPGQPDLAATLARRDASLSHRGEGVHGAEFIAALGAAIPMTDDLESAIDVALKQIPTDCGTADAVDFGRRLANSRNAIDYLHEEYADLSPIHTLNNVALVTWAICSADGDFSAAIGNAVAAGLDTDSNGATVGGIMGLVNQQAPIHWTEPWQGRVGVGLAGVAELQLDDLVARTVAIARDIESNSIDAVASVAGYA